MSIKSCQDAGLDRYALDLKTSPEDIYTLYKSNPQCPTPFLSRLLELKGYDTVLKILDSEKARLLESTDVYQHISDMVLGEASALKEVGALRAFISFFMGLIPQLKCPFQIYLVCKTVSALVVQNGRFASKPQAIRYFKYVSLLFKRAGSFYNYLNSLSVLDTLESVAITEGEFGFLRACVGIRREPACRELLCGMRPAEVDEIFKEKDFQPGEFVGVPNWVRLIEVKRDGRAISQDVEFLSFLKKNGIAFERLPSGDISVGEYTEIGHTTQLFQIARIYEAKAARQDAAPEPGVKSGVCENVPSKGGVAQPSPASAADDSAPVETAEPEFSDRFRVAHKRFKWFYAQTANTFSDAFLEERNSRRQEIFKKASMEYEDRRQALLQREGLLAELVTLLNERVSERRVLERQRLLEQQRLEEERALEERRSKMWRSSRPEPAAPSHYRPPALGSGAFRNTSCSTASESSNDTYVPPHLADQNSKPSGH